MNYNNDSEGLTNYPSYLDIPNDQQSYSFSSNQGHTIQNQQQQQQQERQKKKSRGNRRMQRYRRKLRDQGKDSHRIAELINSCVDLSQSKTNEVAQQNEQTTKSIADEAAVFYPPKLIKKKNKKNKNKKQINEKRTIIKKQNTSSTESMSIRKVKQPSAMINDSIDYANISDEIFSQMSSVVFNRTENFNCFLNEDEKIKFIRHYTSLIDRLSYVQLQEFHWKCYHHIGMTQNIWQGRMAKHLAEKYSISHTYGRSKTLIEQRLNQIKQHIEQAYDTLQQFEEEILSKCTEYDYCASLIRELSSIIHEFVQEKQRPLQYEFEYKRELLILDATDHQLVQKFFDIEPNKSQVRTYSVIYFTTFHASTKIKFILVHHSKTYMASYNETNDD
jgi:hypothetical protein